MKEVIIAEANFLQGYLHELYLEGIITKLVWRNIELRLQRIRDEARKEDDKDSAHT